VARAEVYPFATCFTVIFRDLPIGRIGARLPHPASAGALARLILQIAGATLSIS
jgi:hypothetical protein